MLKCVYELFHDEKYIKTKSHDGIPKNVFFFFLNMKLLIEPFKVLFRIFSSKGLFTLCLKE